MAKSVAISLDGFIDHNVFDGYAFPSVADRLGKELFLKERLRFFSILSSGRSSCRVVDYV